MKKIFALVLIFSFVAGLQAQDRMTPELLWKLGRLSPMGLSADKQYIIYSVSTPVMEENKSNRKIYALHLASLEIKEIEASDNRIPNSRLSADGKYLLTAEDVKMRKVAGSDFYPALTKSNVQIYDGLGYRHWDEWEDGAFSHIFIHPVVNGKAGEGKDIMSGQPYDSPQKPFGGDEDFIWSPDGKSVIYVTKPASGTAYATSTNTDIFQYDLASGKTTNLSERMMGYDVEPAFYANGTLAWLSMRRDGFEADKQDVVVKTGNNVINLTAHWDNSVDAFFWSNDGRKIYFVAAVQGAKHLFEIADATKTNSTIKQLTSGDFDVSAIVAQHQNKMIVSRTDMHHAAELFSVDLSSGQMKQLTHINDSIYARIKPGKSVKRWVTTTDNKKMAVWVIYPPDFDTSKKYPTLLYCQGGPQSPLTQFYSFRWNFQLMAANGYIVVAPNRRGMYGHGRAWNEQISKDWGGQVMKDYLSAIDDVSKEKYVDKERRGCVGASYGGYSAFYLAGIHKNRFKTFIAHDGVFDTRSMSGTTEELWFTNWDFGGNYWEKNNKNAQKIFTQFNPVTFVDKWNAPILIIQGGKDYRVPVEQGLQAFHAAQSRGLRSKLLYFPEENHWILKPQNGLVWQNEFFKWLSETLNTKSH